MTSAPQLMWLVTGF